MKGNVQHREDMPIGRLAARASEIMRSVPEGTWVTLHWHTRGDGTATLWWRT